eukprot:CAMPEP_0202916838 /NCGR_PEP_ID=MMETSP1392-20130828/69592_1 /ASSEMBLY_ACC=CAM_ASM_000868 /TAXON_ID=225041 /ORGANISM="Chlamydomonas chlamydogama, Strain SAG 11-48b" /LENGTH=76 /DNA_ID=CAMNT_0049609397 /DNA_START=113 /DNA_END=341 /DNA_ORIENTATION=-
MTIDPPSMFESENRTSTGAGRRLSRLLCDSSVLPVQGQNQSCHTVLASGPVGAAAYPDLPHVLQVTQLQALPLKHG